MLIKYAEAKQKRKSKEMKVVIDRERVFNITKI